MKPLNANSSNQSEGKPSFSLANRLYRFSWNFSWLVLASWTPAPFHFWRIWLLNAFGAQIHPKARVYGRAKIWYPPNLVMHAYSVLGPEARCYCQDQITIHEKAVVSQGAYLCAGTHDISDPNFQLLTRPIVIGRQAWVAAEAFIGPGVTVDEGAVVGARSVLFKDAEPWGVYIGNPAKRIKTRVFSSSKQNST